MQKTNNTLYSPLLLLVLLVMLLAACSGSESNNNAGGATEQPVYQPPTSGTPIEPPREVVDFTMPDQNGEPLSLSSLQGKPVLIYFGYTYCPDICPTTLADLVRVKQDLDEQGLGDEVHFVVISVDAERDTPAVMKRYLTNFDEDFIGLTGDFDTLQRIGADYGLYVQKREIEGTSADYLIDHSAATYLIDSEGKLQMIYGYGIAPDAITNDLLAMLEATISSS